MTYLASVRPCEKAGKHRRSRGRFDGNSFCHLRCRAERLNLSADLSIAEFRITVCRPVRRLWNGSSPRRAFGNRHCQRMFPEARRMASENILPFWDRLNIFT